MNQTQEKSLYKGSKDDIHQVITSYNLNYNIGNCIKHLLSAKQSGSYYQDLQKAAWYIQKEIELIFPSEAKEESQ